MDRVERHDVPLMALGAAPRNLERCPYGFDTMESGSLPLGCGDPRVGHVGLGEQGAAFAWLERARAEHSQVLTFLKMDPMFDPLCSDQRYAELVRRIGLTP